MSQLNFDNYMLGGKLTPSSTTAMGNKSQMLTKSDILTENEKLDSKIKKLEDENLSKDILIQQLKDEIQELKDKKNFLDVDSDKEDTEVSLLKNLKKSKKNKESAFTSLENVREVESFDASK